MEIGKEEEETTIVEPLEDPVRAEPLEPVEAPAPERKPERVAGRKLGGRLDPGKCRSGRHAWVEKNMFVNGDGNVGCRLCRNERARQYGRARRRSKQGQLVFSAHAPPELHEQVQALARERGVTVSEVVREGLKLLLASDQRHRELGHQTNARGRRERRAPSRSISSRQ
jgi:Arc/MetJ-type ribon-helix-helix transcriptional regulator